MSLLPHQSISYKKENRIETSTRSFKLCDCQVVPRQRKHFVIIISDGKRHHKIHEVKGYITEICQLGGCLDLKISKTLTKHLCIMINAKKDKTEGQQGG